VRVIDPIESFHLQLKEEVVSYERLKRGEFDELENLRGLGQMLISLRIAQGISQRDLAKRLGVHESQVSRDERNEYFGITLERAIRILDTYFTRNLIECSPSTFPLERLTSSTRKRCPSAAPRHCYSTSILSRWCGRAADHRAKVVLSTSTSTTGPMSRRPF
jgi:DNA-binding XRE family transcriptional regulator